MQSHLFFFIILKKKKRKQIQTIPPSQKKKKKMVIELALTYQNILKSMSNEERETFLDKHKDVIDRTHSEWLKTVQESNESRQRRQKADLEQYNAEMGQMGILDKIRSDVDEGANDIDPYETLKQHLEDGTLFSILAIPETSVLDFNNHDGITRVVNQWQVLGDGMR